MKVKYSLLVIIGLMPCLYTCNKDTSGSIQGSIVGKWYVNKEEIKEITGGISKVLDTTYTGTAFNTNDYFQFNSDGTASLSSSGDFEIYGKTTGTDGSGNPINGTNMFDYHISGSILSLTSTFLHPTTCCGAIVPVTDTILHLDANTLILRSSTGSNSLPEITTDTYYTRGN
jgi:hypothetical protein